MKLRSIPKYLFLRLFKGLAAKTAKMYIQMKESGYAEDIEIKEYEE